VSGRDDRNRAPHQAAPPATTVVPVSSAPGGPLTVGRLLGGRYEIRGVLGRGGLGEVWLARDLKLQVDVALKVLPAEFASDPERLQRFEREARATAALSHPNILSAFDIGSHDGSPYIVAELIEGESLRDRLGHGRLPLDTVVDLAAQIARGLEPAAVPAARGVAQAEG